MTQVGRPLPSTTGADPILDDLIEAFAAKLQAGDRIDPEAYAQEHPERGEELRRILPAMLVLADLAQSSGHLLPTGISRGDDSDTALGELGDFRILREIGRGGMGVVYEAEQISLGRRVALKVLPFAAALDPKQLQRFKNEAQAAAHLHHTNIVPVHAVGCERGVHYYAMQFIEGQTLAQVIQELRELAGHGAAAAACVSRRKEQADAKREQQPDAATTPHLVGTTLLRPTARRSFARSPSSACKPPRLWSMRISWGSCIATSSRRTYWSMCAATCGLRISAWRTARARPGLTMTGDLVGTLRYMSPEQALAKRLLIDHRTDIYSLGVTLYELLTLEPAFSGSDREELLQQIAFEEPPSPRQRNKAIPRELETIVLKAMEKNPEGRYATAQELADDLRRFLENKPIRASRPTLAQAL